MLGPLTLLGLGVESLGPVVVSKGPERLPGLHCWRGRDPAATSGATAPATRSATARCRCGAPRAALRSARLWKAPAAGRIRPPRPRGSLRREGRG